MPKCTMFRRSAALHHPPICSVGTTKLRQIMADKAAVLGMRANLDSFAKFILGSIAMSSIELENKFVLKKKVK